MVIFRCRSIQQKAGQRRGRLQGRRRDLQPDDGVRRDE